MNSKPDGDLAGRKRAARARLVCTAGPDLLVFSHLRWDFVYQRPQHLMTRARAGRRVFYIEEASPTMLPAHLYVRQEGEQLWVVTPMLDPDLLGRPT